MRSFDYGATLSEDGNYRYDLTRVIDESNHKCCLFIMLNPSTADHEIDDPTIKRCIGFAKSFDCGYLAVVNLFAIRATDPKDMLAADDPVGKFNMEYVKGWAEQVSGGVMPGAIPINSKHHGPVLPHLPKGPVICAWGTHGKYMDQDETVLGCLESIGIKPQCLKITKEGFPWHPLYLSKDLKPIPYNGRNKN